MTFRYKKICIPFILLLLFCCQKQKIDNKHEEFLGLWTGNNNGQIFFLDISEDRGSSSYEEVGSDPIWGTAKIDRNNNVLHIGSRSFAIDQYPSENTLNGNTFTQMTLEQILYTKN